MSEEMKQGKEYEPEGNSKPKPKKKGKINNTSKLPPNKNILIIGGSILAVILISVGVAYAVTSKDTDVDEFAIEGETVKQGFFAKLFGKEDELDSILDEGFTNMQEEYTFQYTPEERETLIGIGMPEEDIAQNEFDMVPMEVLVEAIELEKEKLIDERFPELKKEALDGASEAYKNLMSKTYLDLKPFTMKVEDNSIFDVSISARETVPYEKLGSKGVQNFVRFNSYTYGHIYTEVPPIQYLEMRDSGSIVANYIIYTDDVGNTIVSDIQLEIVDFVPE